MSESRVQLPPDRPLLVFDGDCSFCRFWVDRWRHQTGDAVAYEPFQGPHGAQRYPEIARERYARAVQLIDTEGRVSEGAEAVFRLRALGGRRAALWAYEQVPGVAPLTERAYRAIADHRALAASLTTLLWGQSPAPSTYARATWLFLRMLGVVYFVAFWSLGSQIRGLAGHDGILPADQYLAAARDLPGLSRFWLLPTLAWINASDAALAGFCIAGCAFAAVLVAGVLPALALLLLWTTYLSLSVVCRDFLSFQWDALLLETGFLAIWVAPLTSRERLRELANPPRVTVVLLLWLLFRLMIGSGAVKLLSGDPTWRDLTALAYHFETQPLPTPVAWYAHLLPPAVLRGATAGVLAIELGAPVLFIGPRRLRILAFVLLIGLQLVIALTGNYAFFNLLTAALCVFLLDDQVLGRWGSHAGANARAYARRRYAPRWLLAVVAVTIVPVSAVIFGASLGIRPAAARIVRPLADLIAPLRSVNAYGLFSIMTTTRPEIVLEGSEDGVTWIEYQFPYKPGDPHRRPRWVAPHQPRLDWQMWFAALGRPEDEPWFDDLVFRLLNADRDVLQLLDGDPFGGRRPQLVRAMLFRYRFTSADERRRSAVWWHREPSGLYLPERALSDFDRVLERPGR